MTATTSTTGRPKKALGQHFLVDSRVVTRIIAAAEVTADDVILEVGPGNGGLTRGLVKNAGRVVAVEMDPYLASSLPERLGFPDNLTVVRDDARTVDIASLVGPGAPYKLVANLPYYAANPIVRRFLESGPQPRVMVVMVQREVARSMTAQPGEMTILSVATQYYAIARRVCHVPPRAFRPPPKVTSTVVHLTPRQEPPVAVDNPPAFFQVVRAGFAAPRKQLRNSLGLGLKEPGEAVGRLLDSSNIDGRRRAETLTLEEWAQIYRSWSQRPGAGSSRSGLPSRQGG